MLISAADRLASVKEYYFSRKLKEVKALNEAGKDIINLGIGSPDKPPHSSVVEALVNVATKPNAHGYQPYVGLVELRTAMAEWLNNTYGIDFNAKDEVLPLIGSKEGITHISLSFLNKGDKVLVPNPGYPTYSSVSELAQAELVPYNLESSNDWQPNFDELEALPNDGSIKLMWVNYPNMPTGAKADLTTFERLISYCKSRKILLVNDNPYSLVLNDEPPFSIFQIEGAKEVALELNSLSKSHNMAGWRVGMLYGNADLIQTILKVKSNVDSGMFKGLQYAAIQALSLGDEWYKPLNDTYEKRRTLVYKLYDLLGLSYNTSRVGMFVWGKVAPGVDAEKSVDDILYNANVFLTPGLIFGSQGDDYIRVSLCATEEKIEQAIKRVKDYLNSK